MATVSLRDEAVELLQQLLRLNTVNPPGNETLAADPAEWERDPWSGELVGDEVWGRGALDMKNQVAASAVALASLAREGFRPSGDLVLIAAADEEVGKSFGLQWLCEEHPEAVRVDYAVNEGG